MKGNSTRKQRCYDFYLEKTILESEIYSLNDVKMIDFESAQ